MNVEILTILIIGIYLIITVAIGIWASRAQKVTTIGDIFTASRSLGILALAMAIFGSQITAFGMLGAPGLAYRFGYSTMGYVLGLAFTPIVGFWIFGSRAWLLSAKFNSVTPVEFFKNRFSSNGPRFVVAFAQIFLMIPYVLILGIGSGNILSSITGGLIPYWLGSLIILIVCTFTAYIGGMKGTAWTNIFQGFLMLIVLFILVVIVYTSLGGGVAITEQLPSNMISLNGEGIQKPGQWIFYSLFATGLANGIFGHMLIRNMSAAHPKTIQLNGKVYPVLAGIFFLLAICLGVWGSIAIPGLEGTANENIVPLLAAKYAPSWMIGLLAAGILSAIMSSWDGMILVMSSIFSEDLYKPIVFKGKKLDDELDKKISKRFIIIISIAVYILVLMKPASILSIATFSFAAMASIIPAYFGCMYWKRATSSAVIISTMTGVITSALWAFNILPDWTTFGIFYGAIAFALSSIALVVISYISKPEKQDILDIFFSAFSQVHND